MVDLNNEVLDVQSLQNLLHNRNDFGIWNHRIILSSDIQITLVKLSESSFSHDRLVPPVYLADVESFNFLYVRIVCHESSKWNSQVVP